MYKKIFLDSTYIDNVGEFNNYGNDKIIELINKTLDNSLIKNVSRILFKAKQFDENTKTFLSEELYNNDAELFLCLKIEHVKIFEKILTELHLHPLNVEWVNSFGTTYNQSEEGACWNNNGLNLTWNGGNYDDSKQIKFNIKDMYDIEEFKYLKFKYDNLLYNDFTTLENLFDKGLILKFNHVAENSPADYFNLYFDKENCFIVAKYNNSTYTINDETDVLIDFNKPFYINDNIKEYYLSKPDKHNTFNINISVTQLTERKSYFNDIAQTINVLPISTSYSIIDITNNNETIIEEDFYYNTINLIDSEMFFEIDTSMLKKKHTYKIIYHIKNNSTGKIITINNYKYFSII